MPMPTEPATAPPVVDAEAFEAEGGGGMLGKAYSALGGFGAGVGELGLSSLRPRARPVEDVHDRESLVVAKRLLGIS